MNRWLDFAERVGWTAIQAAAGALVLVLTDPDVSWLGGLKVVGVAAALAACKVILAQRVGDDDGAAIPGGVRKRTRQRR